MEARLDPGGSAEARPEEAAEARPAEDPAWGFASPHEPRWPAALATLAAILLLVTLPDQLIPGPRFLIPGLLTAVLIPLWLAAPTRHHRERRHIRAVGITLIALVNLANLATLVLLVRELLHGGTISNGRTLVGASIQIYVTNIIVFGLWYWELDRGGPGARTHVRHRNPDFLFPQMTTPRAGPRRWTPTFVDYLYVSVTNATAFSPTDTMPLTPVAKSLMAVQAAASLTTVAVVAARAVNILS
ncbi:MAG TPA: hypothetical protein VI316_06355 [Candidatus Dormibacteraeota bacterium]